MRACPPGLAIACLLWLTVAAPADTIVLRDGTILGGVVRQLPDGYEITSPQGKVSFIPIADVKSIKLSNDGKVTEQSAKERLASLRRSVDSETVISRILDRYKQFIEMNKDTDASEEALTDLALWESRHAQGMVKVGTRWMTPAQRDEHLQKTARLANEIADQIAAGKIHEATVRVTELLEQDPDNLSLAYLDGVLQIKRNRYNEAKRSFDIVYEQIPEHPPTVYNQAAIAAHFKRWTNAIPLFEKAMSLAPGQPEILNGVTEFLRMVPEANRRNIAFDRLLATYNSQEAMLAAEMAKKGLYRFGSTWAGQDKLDEMKAKQDAFEEKKKAMQAEYDASQDRIKQLASSIERIDVQLGQIERDRLYRDPTTGRVLYMPRPQIYYDLTNERDRYTRDIQSEKAKGEDLKRQAKDLESQSPTPPFSGSVQTIGEAGVPIVLPADAPEAPPEDPASRPAEPPILTPLLPATRPGE